MVELLDGMANSVDPDQEHSDLFVYAICRKVGVWK